MGPPDLARCVAILEAVKGDSIESLPPKNVSSIFVASIGLLYHLKADQEKLVIASKGNDPPCPPLSETPAIAAVLNNQILFRALLSCLSATTQSHQHGGLQHADAGEQRTGRKRSLSSADNYLPNKASKSNLSPVPRSGGGYVANEGPAFVVPVFAATALFAAFSHIDHWPAVFVKSYADDLWGARIWVDEFKEFSDNLARTTGSPTAVQLVKGEDSSKVAEAYRIPDIVMSRSSFTSTQSGPLLPLHEITTSGTGNTSGDESLGGMQEDSSSGEEEEEETNGVSERSESMRLYPLVQTSLDLSRVRDRYFGDNFFEARNQIGCALEDRVHQRSKQNSGLLQSLPDFVTIPRVRATIGANLSKWLQSPALTSLATDLFSLTVSSLDSTDPPLEEDLETVDHMLAMRPRKNQWTVYIQNVTTMASRVPYEQVAHRIYSSFMAPEVQETPQDAGRDYWTLMKAVHDVLPREVSYKALASSTMHLLLLEIQQNNSSAIRKVGPVVERVIEAFGHSYDGMSFVEALLRIDVKEASRSIKFEEDRGRLVFRCLILAVKSGKSSDEEVSMVLRRARKIILKWLCKSYIPLRSAAKRKNKKKVNDDISSRACNFQSALNSETEDLISPWLNTVRCMLFMEDPTSDLLRSFLYPYDNGDFSFVEKNAAVVDRCCRLGRSVDSDLIWDVLKSSTMSGGKVEPERTLVVLENLIESCGKGRHGTLTIEGDSTLAWELYSLAEYYPSVDGDMPRLALPGVWWRVTNLVVVLCSFNSSIATTMVKENPTVCSLLKMVTTGRYKFPSVDCDETRREKSKADEAQCRAKEISLAETLFLPPVENGDDDPSQGGRMSRRLKQRLVAKQRAEKAKRKKLLKAAQKWIMLCDPDSPVREPPKEAMKLLKSTNRLFGFASLFHQSESPDFIALSIGGTSRSAIERAYDWLIPVISKLPSVVSRLDSSASCVLLLRAFGTKGEQRVQLMELSGPLLSHVNDSLKGKFGVNGSVNAFNLLMTDVACPSSQRRKSARRVFYECLKGDTNDTHRDFWMLKLLELKSIKTILPSAIEFMTQAARYDGGEVLTSFVIALKAHIGYASANDIPVKCAFHDLVIDLVDRRPHVVAAAVKTSEELLDICIESVHDYVISSSQSQPEGSIKLTLFPSRLSENEPQTVSLSLKALHCICVLLQLWEKDETNNNEDRSSGRIMSIADALLVSPSADAMATEKPLGMASAKREDISEERIKSLWVLLITASSDFISERAALSAQLECLPAFLFCTGLTRAPFEVMMNRLAMCQSKGTDSTDGDIDHVFDYSQLKAWGLGIYGTKEDVMYRLHNRILAYRSDFELSPETDALQAPFLAWLATAAKIVPSQDLSTPAMPSVLATLSPLEEATEDMMSLTLQQEGGWKTKQASPNTQELSAIVASENREQLACKVRDLLKSNQSLETETREVTEIYLSSSLAQGMVTSVALSLAQISATTGKCVDLWRDLFSEQVSDEKFGRLLHVCLRFWEHEDTKACVQWILNTPDKQKQFHVEHVSEFLFHEVDAAMELEDQRKAMEWAMLCFRVEVNGDKPNRFFGKQGLSWGLALALHVISLGEESFNLVKDAVLGSSTGNKAILDALVLRLYLLHPKRIDTQVEQTRNRLLAVAADEHWLSWPCGMEIPYRNMMQALSEGNTRMIKVLTEKVRTHPLLVIRQFGNMAHLLRQDAAQLRTTNAGVTHGSSTMEPLQFTHDRTRKKVTMMVRHWGYSYTEPLWASLLDIVSTTPPPLLFYMGKRKGLHELLSVYIQLLSVQLQLLSTGQVKRVQSKVKELVGSYKQNHLAGWKEWMSTTIDGLEVRHVLVSCSLLTPQEAIASAKS